MKAVILLFMPSMNGVTAFAADTDEIIEFRGDRYVIHVDRMKPDSTMTLLDVLNTCPEFLSVNGKKIDLNYIFRVDNIALVMETLENRQQYGLRGAVHPEPADEPLFHP